MTVYIFGGLVMSNEEACPYGFWGGALINVALCWFLKLFACAIQQKCIGENLGRSLWVRRTVGVHKVAIRCIEGVMRQPGMNLGKVAILCGGPDWPTSVLAGVLRLSVVQCEIGTVPIIFFVAPCALTGSFYLQKGKSDLWTKSANMMIVLSVAVNMTLWAMAVWAIERHHGRHAHELSRPLKQNVDLEWLDFRDGEMEKASAVSWHTVPRHVRWCYALGAIVHVGVNNLFFWAYYSLFGDFQVSQGIDEMRWYNDGTSSTSTGIFTLYSVTALSLYAVLWICPIVVAIWRYRHTKALRLKTAQTLDASELKWKEDWLKAAEEWSGPVQHDNRMSKILDTPSEILDSYCSSHGVSSRDGMTVHNPAHMVTTTATGAAVTYY